MISFRHKGSFDKTEKYLKNAKNAIEHFNFDKYGQAGVAALASATPVDTGLTARSWYYEVVRNKGSVSIKWYNSNIQSGVPIAVIIQYGHGTNNGGYVEGVDYINPALVSVFNDLAESAWREVKSL